MINISELKRKLDEFQKSAEGVAYFIREEEKCKTLEERYKRFNDWMIDNDFDVFFNKLMLKHDNAYRNKCYRNGYEPKPNNVLNFVLGYIEMKCSPVIVDELECEFSDVIWNFNNYYIQSIHGQGVITRIYNGNNFMLMLQI